MANTTVDISALQKIFTGGTEQFAISMNITDNGSTANSIAFRLRTNNVTKFSVDKYGNVLTANGIYSNGINTLEHANNAYQQSNTLNSLYAAGFADVYSRGNTSWTVANTANVIAVQSGTVGNSAFAAANTANGVTGIGYLHATGAYAIANTANGVTGIGYLHATGAYAIANTANTTANFANTTANLALPLSGGTMTGNLVIRGLQESNSAVVISANTLTLNISNGTIFTTNANSNVTTFSIVGTPDGKATSCTLILTGNGTTYTQVWNSVNNILWSSNVAPILTTTNNKVDIISFINIGLSTNNWYGVIAGQNY